MLRTGTSGEGADALSEERAARGPAAGSGFLQLPASAVGRITALLFVVVVVSMALMATVVESSNPSWRGAFALFVVASVVAAAVLGVVAVLAKRERSWAVVIPALLGVAIVVNELVQQLRSLV
jgi:membrane associated rhomboid family serine protease